MTTKYDKFIIILLFILSVLFFSVFAYYGKSSERVLNIFSDGRLYASYDLEALKSDAEIKVENENGYLTVYISGEKCYVTDSDCKDKLCMRQYPINNAGETITCLPNKIFMEIVAESNDEDVDMVAF